MGKKCSVSTTIHKITISCKHPKEIIEKALSYQSEVKRLYEFLTYVTLLIDGLSNDIDDTAKGCPTNRNLNDMCKEFQKIRYFFLKKKNASHKPKINK